MKSNKWVKTSQQIAYFPLYWTTGKLFIRSKYIEERITSGERVMIISNHISFLDAFLVIAQYSFSEIRMITPIRTITANKYVNSRLYGFTLRWLGCFPAKEASGHLFGLRGAIEYARQNNSLFFFPEGGRASKGLSDKLHSGAAVVANNSSVRTIPVFIQRKSFFTFRIIRGESFDATGLKIEEMMDKVWELEQFVAE